MAKLETMTIEEALVHFGTKGMKWGVRKGRGTTGLTRHRGAIIDRNNREKAVLNKALKGEKYKRTVALGNHLAGKDVMQRNMKTRIKDLNSQNSRVKSGKLIIGDRMDLALNVSISDLLITRTPR